MLSRSSRNSVAGSVRSSTSRDRQRGKYEKVEQGQEAQQSQLKRRCMEQIKLCIRSTPYKSVSGRVGSTGGKFCNYCCSVLLATSLILIGVLFSSLPIYKYVEGAQICVAPQNKTSAYLEEYKRITKYDQLKSVGPRSRNVTLELFEQASKKYSYRETQWPQPYQHSEAELLSQSQRECKRKVCVDSWGFSWLCKTISIPCPLSLDTEGLYFGGGGFNSSQTVNFTDIHHEVSSTVNMYLFEIWERMNIVASFYCYYMAAMVFVGAPYVITSRPLTVKCRFALSSLTKPWFIVAVLLLWYSMEILQFVWTAFFIQLDVIQLVQFAIKDPCFADVDFLTTMYSEGASICGDIEYSSNLYDASVSNLDYYTSVEDTYQYYYWADQAFRANNAASDIRYGPEDRIFAEDDLLASQFNVVWDDRNATECSVSSMFDYIGPGPDSSFDVWSFILFSGAFAALLMQPVLANLTRTVFIMIDPLSPYCGRIEIPYKLENDEELLAVSNKAFEELQKEFDSKGLLKDIKRFERSKNWCPCCFWFIVLLLSILNIAGVNILRHNV